MSIYARPESQKIAPKQERDWETIDKAEAAISEWLHSHPEYRHRESSCRRSTYQHDLRVRRLKRGIGYSICAVLFMTFCIAVLYLYPYLK